MSSKQINFFLSPNDISEVNDFFLEKECKILKRIAKKPGVPVNYDIVKNPESIFQVYLCKDEYIDKVFYEYIETKNQYYIDILKSYCIEFSIGGFYPYSHKEYHSSRFYYIFDYYENDEIVRKDEKFINWADDIFKSFKKQFLKKNVKHSKDFLSTNFINWAMENNTKSTVDGTKFIIS